jgi:alpha-L-fucosidase
MIRKKNVYPFKGLCISVFLTGIFISSTIQAQTAPTPMSLTPNSRQIEWFHREQQAFIHFNMNTFTDKEWGNGNESENLFNPTNLDCGQWMRVFKAAGMTTAILVIKHHDGFCLWPTAYTTHSVKYSSWKGGNGDVLREFTDSCHAYGIKAAIYLSPWDMHQSATFYDGTTNPNPEHLFGTKDYVDYYCNQIVELCKNKPYGPLYEIWQDGAGDINAISPADYRKWTDTIHKYMPECVVWSTKKSDSCGDIRWVCNELGVAGDPCWSTAYMSQVLEETGNMGDSNGDTYIPAETNVSIRPGWFYHTTEEPKSVSTLWNMYFTSTARNTVWLLNFPPDTVGRIASSDSVSGAGLGSYLYGTFRTNLLAGATVTALHPRGAGFEPANMVDNYESTYFASADGYNTDTITFVPTSSITFDCIMMQEVIELGHRTLNWSVDAYYNNAWNTISDANNKQCIGYKRAVMCSQRTATQVRLRITSGKACPAIHTFGVYKQTQVTPPSNWNGLPPIVDSTTTMVSPGRAAAHLAQQNILRIAGDWIVLPADFGAGAVTVNILDIQGRSVRSFVTQASGFEQRMFLPSLKSGLYFVKCSNGRQTLEQRFMNMH